MTFAPAALLVAWLLMITGCGRRVLTLPTNVVATGTKTQQTSTMHINGIDYELPWPVDAVEAIKAGQLEAQQKGFAFANDHYKLDVVNGQLKLNGKEYGSINRGDRVKLTEGGVLSVNGGERKPQ
jgi:hypothetical protein